MTYPYTKKIKNLAVNMATAAPNKVPWDELLAAACFVVCFAVSRVQQEKRAVAYELALDIMAKIMKNSDKAERREKAK